MATHVIFLGAITKAEARSRDANCFTFESETRGGCHNTNTSSLQCLCSAHARSTKAFVPCKHQNSAGLTDAVSQYVLPPRPCLDDAEGLERSNDSRDRTGPPTRSWEGAPCGRRVQVVPSARVPPPPLSFGKRSLRHVPTVISLRHHNHVILGPSQFGDHSTEVCHTRLGQDMLRPRRRICSRRRAPTATPHLLSTTYPDRDAASTLYSARVGALYHG
jgi:hypothetical protein